MCVLLFGNWALEECLYRCPPARRRPPNSRQLRSSEVIPWSGAKSPNPFTAPTRHASAAGLPLKLTRHAHGRALVLRRMKTADLQVDAGRANGIDDACISRSECNRSGDHIVAPSSTPKPQSPAMSNEKKDNNAAGVSGAPVYPQSSVGKRFSSAPRSANYNSLPGILVMTLAACAASGRDWSHVDSRRRAPTTEGSACGARSPRSRAGMLCNCRRNFLHFGSLALCYEIRRLSGGPDVRGRHPRTDHRNYAEQPLSSSTPRAFAHVCRCSLTPWVRSAPASDVSIVRLSHTPTPSGRPACASQTEIATGSFLSTAAGVDWIARAFL